MVLDRKKLFIKSGFSLIEVLLASSIFVLVVTSLIGAIIYAQQSSRVNGDRTRAILLLDEAMEAMRSIRSDSWNEIVLNQSGLEQSGGEWNFIGEGSTETIDKFTRKIELMDVCRDSSDQIVGCPGAYLDVDTKQVMITVNWQARPGVITGISDTMYITNWMTEEWTQTDWSGGAGQSIWSDPARFDSNTGSLDFSTPGEIKVGSCQPITWGFDTPGNYTYDTNKIEVVSSNASLKLVPNGTINKSLIDSLEFDTSDGRDHFIIHISGNIFAVAYRGSGNDGFINTMEILPDGNISNSRIDYLEFDTSSGYEPSVVHVSGDIYAIAYRGSGNDGFVRTVSIDSSGQISNSTIDSLEFDTSNGYYPKIIKVGDGMFAVAYMGSGNDGFVSTMSINAAGAIGNSVTDTYEFDTDNGSYPDIINISGTVYAITYTGSGNDGFVVTLNISTAGVITNSIIDSLEFINDDAYDSEIINVVNDIYVVVYRATSSNQGYLSTFQIQSNGVISNSSIDTQTFDSVYTYYPEIRKLDNKLFGIVYQGSGNDGYISTVIIQDSGTIQMPLIDTYEYDTSNGTEPDLIHVTGNIFAVAYSGNGSDGYISTLSINLTQYPADRPSINPNSSYQNNSVGAWTSFNEIANKNGGQIYYQLSDDDGVTWNYWDGSAWGTAGSNNYNDASTVNSNISFFIATAKKIRFKAFLESNGTQLVQLDSITIECSSSFDGFVDDTAAEFNAGVHSNTQWNVNGWVDLTPAGKTAGLGQYTSSVKDARSSTTWTNFGWAPKSPYQKELPNNGGTDSGYDSGNLNMNGNVLLMHLNESSGTLLDSSGQSNNGANQGATYGAGGRYNTAIQFNGSTNYIDIPNSTSLNPTSEITLEAWVKWNIVPSSGNGWAQIIDKNSDNGYQIQHSSNNSAFEFALQTTSARTYIIGGTSPVQGVWYHVVGVYNGSTIRIFVNGNLDGTNNLSGTIVPNTSNVNIGRRTSGDRYFNGVIDEVAIYNRALSPIEIQERYLRGALRLNIQVRSCNNPSCTGATFIGPDGTAGTYYSELNNTSAALPELTLTNVPNNRYFQYRMYLQTDNSSYSPEIKSVTVNKSGGSGGGSSMGTVYSSAYNTSRVSNFASLEWSQMAIPSCPICSIKLQIRCAPDNFGSPGSWTDWYGPNGIGTYFTLYSGSIIPEALNGNQWIQYKAELTGDGNNSPSLEEIRIKYK